MPFKVGTPELLILLVIVLLLFGVGRIGRIASELGRGIREFRHGLTEPDDKNAEEEKSKAQES